MRDLTEIFDGEGFAIPAKGKIYTIAPIGYQDAFKLVRAAEAFETVVDPQAEPADIEAARPDLLTDDQYQRLTLGSVLDQMRTDNLPSTWITHAAMLAGVYHIKGRAVAEQMRDEGPSPEALAVSMQAATQLQIQAQAVLDASTTSPSTAADASSTKPPANTNGTTARPRKAPARRSTGAKSPTRGRSSSQTSPRNTASG